MGPNLFKYLFLGKWWLFVPCKFEFKCSFFKYTMIKNANANFSYLFHPYKNWPHFLPNKNEVLLCINCFKKCDPKCPKTSTVLLLFLYTRPRHILVIEIWSILPQNITTLIKQKSIFAKSPRNFTILFFPSLKNVALRTTKWKYR